MTRPAISQNPRERGSALLIVFVFAAMIAIMLYKELPVDAFESERNEEQLTIDRGNEYAHAVKLYYRKFGNYPASIDQLENTNQMRFLRHRFKDPLTVDGEWRFLHGLPNAGIVDSKVNPIQTNLTGMSPNGTSAGTNANGTPSAASGTGANSASASTSSVFSSSSADDTAAQNTMPALPQRPPAVAANGGTPGQVANPADASADPTKPLLTPSQMAAAQNGPPGVGGNGTGTPDTGNTTTGTPGAPGATPDASAANPGSQPTSPTAANGSNTNASGSSSQSRMGVLNSAGIAGVASKAKGHSIKSVNDQTDYSLWEFFYDPRKDATRGLGNAIAGMQGGAQNGLQNSSAQNPSGQNQSTQNSGGATMQVTPGANQPGAVLPSAPTNPGATSTNPPQ